MPQCPNCNAAVWVGQQYCTTCTNPLPHTDEEKYICPQCGIPLATPQELCQSCKVTQEISEIPAAASAKTWRLPLRVPSICIGAGLLSVALLLVFLFQKSLGPPQLLMAPSSPAVSDQTPTAPPIPASEKTPSVSKVAAVQKLTVPSAPAISSPPAVTGPTPSLPRYFVNTHELTVRDGPDMDASYITFLNFKDEVELLETSGGWGRVQDMRRKIIGWANMRYLQRLAVDGPGHVPKHQLLGPKEAESISSKTPRVM